MKLVTDNPLIKDISPKVYLSSLPSLIPAGAMTNATLTKELNLLGFSILTSLFVIHVKSFLFSVCI